MQNARVERVDNSPLNFMGQSPYWDTDKNVLLYTDNKSGTIIRYDMNDDKFNMTKINGEDQVSFVIPVRDQRDQYVVGAGRRLLLITWDGQNSNCQIDRVLGDINKNDVRLNHGKTDNKGRLFTGTMLDENNNDNIYDLNKKIGSLLNFDNQRGFKELRNKVGLSNGIAFNNKQDKMYWVDSFDLNIKQFDYDVNNGNISNEKVVVDLNQHGKQKHNVAHGLTTDNNDNLYVTMFGGNKILRFNKNGQQDGEINLNTQQITNLTFGGRNNDVLFVTTAAQDVMGKQNKDAGYLYKVTNIGAKGNQNNNQGFNMKM